MPYTEGGWYISTLRLHSVAKTLFFLHPPIR